MIDIGLPLPFAAGSVIYIASGALVPRLKSVELRAQLTDLAAFLAGMGVVPVVA